MNHIPHIRANDATRIRDKLRTTQGTARSWIKRGRSLYLGRAPFPVVSLCRSIDDDGPPMRRRLRGVQCVSVMSATTWYLYQRSMAFISRVRDDLRLETRAIRGDAKGERGWREPRPARISKGRRATNVNTTSGANPSGGFLAALPAFYLRTSRLLRSHTFARQVRTRIYATSRRAHTRRFCRAHKSHSHAFCKSGIVGSDKVFQLEN